MGIRWAEGSDATSGESWKTAQALLAQGDESASETPKLVLSGGTVTESQNHGMVGVGRDLCGSSSPNPC